MQDSARTFDISLFTRMISTDKFELGKEYALNLDANDCIEDSMIDYRKSFVLLKTNEPLDASDENTFSNPMKKKEPVACRFLYQKYLKNCSIVYFEFVPMRQFINGTYEVINLSFGVLGRIGTDHIQSDNVPDKYIITDDLDNFYDIGSKESDEVGFEIIDDTTEPAK